MKDQTDVDKSASCEEAFDQFVAAVTCKSILSSFHHLLDLTGLQHEDTAFYQKLKNKLKCSWKAQSLWAKLDKRAAHKDYKKGQSCSNMRVLIIGSGPCGLRMAIECAFLGAKTVIVEKRDRFSRNNVLHLWPFLITDLRNLGAKKFFGKFCAGAIDHISIRQLQCILLKVALLLGVQIHMNVTFEGLVEPPNDQSSGVGWKCKVTPENHILSEYEFDVLIGADGKRNTLPGFKRKEFRGKLALAITANFINRNTRAEARVEEICGVAFIFNQKFFMDLKESTKIDLENIVYYKDDTHYFVMTAKKASLLEKGVLKEDFSDTLALLDGSNVNQNALMAYAREAADFSTNYQLPSLDYAVNHYGQADVAMFDFTSMYAAENASKFILRNSHHLLIGLVGDSLLEPFWPTGSGCARGFLSAFDAAWMIRSWATGKTPLQVLAERESIYTVLSQTTPGYLNKNYNMYSLDPNTRYPNLNLKAVMPTQVRHLYDGGTFDTKELEERSHVLIVPNKKLRNVDTSGSDSYNLLQWCQKVLNTGKYRGVHVVDFTHSWRSGLALCALIHSFRPEVIDYAQLLESDIAANNQLAFSVAENELGIPPVMTGEDMVKCVVPDKLTMVSYLAQFYDVFRHDPLISPAPLEVSTRSKTSADAKKSRRSSNRRISILQKLNSRLAKSKKRKEQEENEGRPLRLKKLKETNEEEVDVTQGSKLPMQEIANRQQLDQRKDKMNKSGEMPGSVSVTAMADILVAKFRSHEGIPPPEPARKLKNQPSFHAASAASETCYFCDKKVYIMERMSAEGEFFHRGCLKCDHCGMGLRLTNYSCDRDVKPVKFYCYRHAVPEMRIRLQRKRTLEDAIQKGVPDVIITPASGIDLAQSSKGKSHATPHQAHLLPSITDMSKNTPERVEFEISFDGEVEPEEEQLEHNLRSSLPSDVLLDEDSNSESSDSDVDSNIKDVWINAKSSHTPVMLEEARELRGTWKANQFRENSTDISGAANLQKILKKSLKGLKVSDVDIGRGNTGYNELVQKDEKIKLLKQKVVNQAVMRYLQVTRFPRNSTAENLIESSDLGKNEVFIEGRLSPSASRTRRFRMKRHTKHTKERHTHSKKISKEESLSRNLISEVNNLPCHEQVNSKEVSARAEADNDFLQQVLNNVADMTHTSDTDDLIFSNVDNRYVTDRHKKLLKQINSALGKKVKDTSLVSNIEFAAMDSSFSISTPSESESSVSSIDLDEFTNSLLETECNNGYSRPYEDVSQEHSAEKTKLALGDYCVNIENSKRVTAVSRKGIVDNNKDLLKAVVENNYNNNICEHSGVNENPNTLSSDILYTAQDDNIKAPRTPSSSILTPRSLTRPLPPPGSQVLFPSANRSLENIVSKAATSTNSAASFKADGQASSRKEVLLSSVENKVNKQSSSLASSKFTEVMKTPQPTNAVLNKGQFKSDKPLASAFTKYPSDTTVTSSQTVKSQRILPDLPKLNILTKRLPPKVDSFTHQPVTLLSSQFIPETTTKDCNANGNNIIFSTTCKTKAHTSSNTDLATVNDNKPSSSYKTGTAIYESPLSPPLKEALRTAALVNTNEQKLVFTPKHFKPFKMETKKKFFAEGDSIKHSLENDSLVLDESEDEEQFYTPCAPAGEEREFFVRDKNEIGEAFYTPFADDKKEKPKFVKYSSEHCDSEQASSISSPVYKEITNSTVLSSQQIRDICKADIENARMQARNRAKLKSDEELGITVVNPSYTNKVQVLSRHPSGKAVSHVRQGSCFDTNVISGSASDSNNNMALSHETTATISTAKDVQLSQYASSIADKTEESLVSVVNPSHTNSTQVLDKPTLMKTDSSAKYDSNHPTKEISSSQSTNRENIKVSSLQTADSSTIAGDQLSQPAPNKSKKTKQKAQKTKDETKDKESEVKDKKVKFFSSLINLTKHRKKGVKESIVILSPDSSPKESDKSQKTKSKTKKMKKKKVKPPKNKHDFPYCQDLSGNTDYGKNLAICSVFHSDISSRQTKNSLDVSAAKKYLLSAPRTYISGDEISDSDSYISLSPIQKRRNEDLETRVARRLRVIQQKQQKQAEQKRLRMAQEIQRQLEEVEVRQRDLEDRGIAVEKALREDASESEDDSQLMSEWFTLVHEKNALLRYESELMVRAKELELEDRQARLEISFRERSKQGETKTNTELEVEDKLLEELLDVVEQRNSLVAMLEEDRLREQREDNELKEMMAKKGYVLSPLSFDTSGKEGRHTETSPV